MKKTISCVILLLGLITVQAGIADEEIDKIAAKVSEYTAAGNYPKALEELAWYKKELEKRNFKKILEFFQEDLAGFKRQSPKTQSAVGIITIETSYKKNSEKIKATLTGSSGGTAGAMGGLAAFGHLAAMQSGASGHDSFRLNGFTATLNQQRRRPELSVILDNGWIIKFVAAEASAARSFANEFPIVELNDYLKGNF
ncbi:MAG: hypothetical protein GY807_19145 [Gammaproteobacteria bacterium]|nr:hypothetical protein [Gammaproteobacteria bacterium]